MIKECSKRTKYQSSQILDEIIEKNLQCLKRIKTPANYLPLFNGATEENLDDFNKFLSTLNYKIKNINKNVGGIYILKNKKELVYFDCDNPPKKNILNPTNLVHYLLNIFLKVIKLLLIVVMVLIYLKKQNY